MKNIQMFFQNDLMALAGESMEKTRQLLASKEAPSLTSVIRIYEAADARLSKAAPSQQLQCSHGCDYCCHYRVMVSPLEVLAIAEHVNSWPAPRKARLMAKLDVHLAAIKKLTPKQHLLTNLPCMLLEDHSCSIYHLRPIACRTHHEVSDVATCKETFLKPESPAQGMKFASIQAVGDGVKVGFDQYHRSEGLDKNWYEFGAALYEALTSTTCFKRYRNGKVVFPSVKDRGELGYDNEL